LSLQWVSTKLYDLRTYGWRYKESNAGWISYKT